MSSRQKKSHSQTLESTNDQLTTPTDPDLSFPLVDAEAAKPPASKPTTIADLDPRIIFNASIEFQHTVPKAFPEKFEYRRPSTSSLYPSLDSLSHPDTTLDVDRQWDAARKQPHKRRPSKRNELFTAASGVSPRDNDNLSAASQPAYEAFAPTAAARMPGTVSPVATRAAIARTATWTYDEIVAQKVEWYQKVYASELPVTAHARGQGDSSDADRVARKLAAYGGRSDEVYEYHPTSVAALPGSDPMPSDDMVAWKLAAYEGRSVPREAHLTVPISGQQVQATVVDYDVHPSDMSAVQAEFVTPVATTGETAEAIVIESGPAEKATAEAWSAAPAAEATVLHDSNLLAEVTDLDSKPPARDPRLDEGNLFFQSDPNTRTPSMNQEALGMPVDQQIEAMIVRQEPLLEQGSLQQVEATLLQQEALDPPTNQQAEALIVDIDVHPSEFSRGAIHAEFVGQDYHAAIVVDHGCSDGLVAARDAHIARSSAASTYEANGDELIEDDVAEVAVIESGPMEKATAEAWSTATTSGEAQVLEHPSAIPASPFVSKPPSQDATESWMSEAPGEGSFAMANGEAEVIRISEDAHPSEFVDSEASVQAELIGSDFNTAIAIPSNGQDRTNTNEAGGELELAEIVGSDVASSTIESSGVGNSQQPLPQEAHATIVVSQGEIPEFDHQPSIVTPVVAVLEQTIPSGRTVSDPRPITTVSILETSHVSPPAAVSFADPVKPDPFSGRVVSAPPSTGPSEATYSSHSQLPDVPGAQEPEWTRAPSFGGSEGAPASIPPPVATATEVISVEAVPPAMPCPSPVVPTTSTASRSSWNSTRSSMSHSDGAVPGLNVLSSNIARGANNVMETLFGNGRPGRRQQELVGFDLDEMSGSVLPRTLLPSSVIYSEATNSWVATVNTNQKALEANDVEESSKALRAFSVPTKKQAMALASAWAPPQMHPFDSNPVCFICESQFAVFRRACHCRNCGVCVCGPCSVQWPSKMLPVTYNIKRESMVNICKACDWLCSTFRLTLLQGDHDKAVALHSTGNINLTTPFANVKGELFYPVHCAVLGGDLTLLQWLVDEHCCPLRSIRISNGKQKNSVGSYTPILTSKGRSLLGIALGNRNVGIVRYLVVEKRMLLSAEKGLSVETLTQNLDLVLRVLPEEVLGEQAFDSIGRQSNPARLGAVSLTETAYLDSDVDVTAISIAGGGFNDSAEGLAENECIICFDNPINCVFTPCGHQICCIECGNHISRCPVCAAECSPMRVFKP